MAETENLKTENEALKKANAVKSDLISISAHQLRTSLSAMKWILKMFLDKDIGELSPEQETFIKKAIDSNERMIHLVNDMLTLNHTEETVLSFKMAPVDIVKLIEETFFEFSGEANKKGIELIFLRPDDKIPDIHCDKEMIRVVLQNLIENAIKYSDKNGKVFISIVEKENTLEVSVRDTGIGIKAENQEQIFDKFYRTDEAKKKDNIGSGLGLFTTKKIIDYHKGKIWFESVIGKGTTFYFGLPIVK